MPFIARYAVGDRVMITNNEVNSDGETQHDFAIGEIVTIREIDSDDAKLPYRVLGDATGSDWIGENQCEPEIQPEKRMATAGNLRNLDIVMGSSDVYLVVRQMDGESLSDGTRRVLRLKSFNSRSYPEGKMRTMNAKLMDTYEIVANLEDIAGELHELL